MEHINLNTLLVVIFLGIVILACKRDTPPEKEAIYMQDKDGIIVFVDKSLSIEYSSEMAAILQEVKLLLNDLLHDPEECIDGYFIHENTLSGKSFLSQKLEWDVISPEQEKKMGKRSLRKAIKNINKERDSQKDQIFVAIKDAVNTQRDKSTNQQTDIWASLEAASRSFKQFPGSLNQKHIFYISDMEESVKGNRRRDFTTKAPSDKTEAEDWANEDIKYILESYSIEPSLLKNTQVYTFLPKNAQQKTDYQFVRYYWEALFNALGMELKATY